MNEAEIDQALAAAEQTLRNAQSGAMPQQPSLQQPAPAQLDPRLIQQMVDAAVRQALAGVNVIPGPSGADGMTPTHEHVSDIVHEVVAKTPLPKGDKGDPGERGPRGPRGEIVRTLERITDPRRMGESDGSSLVGFLQSGTGAVSRTVAAKLAGGLPISIEDFGGGPSKTAAQNYTAWLAAFAALPTPQGGTIEFEAADLYDLSTMLTGDGSKRVSIIGRGCGAQGSSGTKLRFPAGVGGVNLKNGSGGFGGRSRLAHVRLIGQDVGVGTNDGLLLQANSAQIEDVEIESFGRHGCYVYSSAVDTGSINANLFHIRNLRCVSNFVDGFKTEGVNSNAGTIIGLDCTTNTGWGVNEIAVLGNTYIGPHFQGNTAGCLRFSSGGSRVRMYGVYKEQDGGVAVQIDAGNSGWHDINFLEMNGTVTDGGTNKSRITTILNGEVCTNRVVIGDSGGAQIYLYNSGMLVDLGKTVQFRDSSQSHSWDMAAQADQSMRVRQIAGAGPWNYQGVRVNHAQGATVASANNLVLGVDGNRFQISGTTQIDLIDNTNFQGGSVVTLHFQGNVTVKHNQAASGNNKPIMLSAAGDFSGTANDQLTLQYDSTDSKWYEIARTVI
jgi:hypothetical protein